MVPEKKFSELGKSAFENQLSEESSSESESEGSGHTKMDLDPEGETPEHEEQNDASSPGSSYHGDTFHKEQEITQSYKYRGPKKN